ncbi:uroporphyrinogen-III synthase [Tateyamaria omphalii]|uniref:uroporphyrinogen-III synthase n=1 Tax=Tateyamaria omphalii TaxID=299262 RepID=UPI001C999ED8|nr:uroporphyrinogen-III synthase [Tateyamaria omphalii]MBY5933437.1 uroporphyrinogen-III synthase [Tateyamaria omphalii]
MTRPLAAAERFVEEMPDDLMARVTPVFSPLLRIEPTGDALGLLPDMAAIFSSSNGVQYGPEGAGRMAYCVGARTTAQAKAKGWSAQMAGQDADALVSYVIGNPPNKSLVHIRGRHTRGDIAGRLVTAGHTVTEAIVYDQVPQPLNNAARTAMIESDATIVPLFSPRTAVEFAKQDPRAKCLNVIALSAAVAEAAHPLKVHSVAERPDAAAMYAAIRQAISSG